MHPKGVYELINLGGKERISAHGEYFVGASSQSPMFTN